MIRVTVATKTPQHPLYGRGAPFGYVVNGVEGATLALTRDETYVFDVVAQGHPFFLSTSATGGPASREATALSPPIDLGQLSVKLGNDFPDTFYYQCAAHEGMGGKVEVHSHHSIILSETMRGFASPVELTFAPKEPDTLYLADQPGRVFKIHGGTSDLFLDMGAYLPALSPGYDERGLLGLCFRPDFTTESGRFFVFYSSAQAKRPAARSGASYYNCLSEFEVRNGAVQYDREKVLMQIPKTTHIHNGGKIAFGPDGFLYVAIGDGGDPADAGMNAQFLNLPYGKVLRIDATATGLATFAVPPENPFIGRGLPEIYAFGFRNPWGLSFWKGRLILTDAGSDTGIGKERIYIVVGGGNHGWPIVEGSHKRSSDADTWPVGSFVPPVFEYTTGDTLFAADPYMSAIIGGYALGDDYLFGDVSGTVHRLALTQRASYVEGTRLPRGEYLKSFGRDGVGHVYALASESLGPAGPGAVYLVTLT